MTRGSGCPSVFVPICETRVPLVLPQNDEVLRRRFLEGQSSGNIAKATGLTRKAIYRRCTRLKAVCPELTAIVAKYRARLKVDI